MSSLFQEQGTDSVQLGVVSFPLLTSSDETFGGPLDVQPFLVPGTSCLVGKAWATLKEVKDTLIVEDAKKLLYAFHETIPLIHKFGIDTAYIPPLYPSRGEDGSLLFEWVFPDLRIGFSIEQSRKESNWFLVSNTSLGEAGASGYLENVDMRKIILWLLTFVLLHS
jgi:hypothetical protein